MTTRPGWFGTVNPDIVHRSEAFGGVLFNLETKDYFPLNDSGYLLFRLLADGAPRARLIGALGDRCLDDSGTRPDLATLEGAGETFMARLQALDIIRRPCSEAVPSPVGATSSGPDRQVAPRLRAPLVVSLATLFRCNLSCAHCYVGSTNEDKEDNLSLDEICTLLERLREAGVFDVVLTGGEALLAVGIEAILRHAKALGFYVCLNTNGTLITAPLANRLAATGVDVVKISLDSADAAVHDAFRGQARAFARSIRGIEALVGAGVRTDTHTVISAGASTTPRDIEALLALAQRLGVTRAHFGRVFSTGRASDTLKLANERIRALSDYVARRKADGEALIGRVPSTLQPHVPALPDYDGCGGCARGVYAYIGYNGEVFPCTNLYAAPWRLGSLRTAGLETIWHASPVLATLREHLADAEAALTATGAAVHE